MKKTRIQLSRRHLLTISSRINFVCSVLLTFCNPSDEKIAVILLKTKTIDLVRVYSILSFKASSAGTKFFVYREQKLISMKHKRMSCLIFIERFQITIQVKKQCRTLIVFFVAARAECHAATRRGMDH